MWERDDGRSRGAERSVRREDVREGGKVWKGNRYDYQGNSQNSPPHGRVWSQQRKNGEKEEREREDREREKRRRRRV